jgi:hypothetical protein
MNHEYIEFDMTGSNLSKSHDTASVVKPVTLKNALQDMPPSGGYPEVRFS